MFNTCYNCGQYHADKAIDPDGPFAVCPECGYRHPFRQLPLLLVGGASGVGKSVVCSQLAGSVNAVVLESDILWRPEFNTPENQYRDFFEMWLQMAKNISQSGQPVILFGAGFAVPSNIELCIERRYFSTIHYLALVCEDDVLADRLRQRPSWRASHSDDFIEAQQAFNRWLLDYDEASPTLSRIDTTRVALPETVSAVQVWVNSILA